MAADVDIFRIGGQCPRSPARLRGAACGAVRAGAVRLPDSQRPRRELGRHRRRRRRDERDPGQQHSLAGSADADAERAGQRIEGTGAIAAQRNSEGRAEGNSRFPSARPSTREQRESAQKKPPPKEVAKVEENQIPFGQGGPVSGPYGSFTAGGTKGGLSFTGGTGDFGSRFGWYVDAVRRKVSENWLKYEIDPQHRYRAPGLHLLRNHALRPAGRIFEWNSPAEFRRSISRRCGRCSGSIPSVRCRRSTPDDTSQWSSGSITSR